MNNSLRQIKDISGGLGHGSQLGVKPMNHNGSIDSSEYNKNGLIIDTKTEVDEGIDNSAIMLI